MDPLPLPVIPRAFETLPTGTELEHHDALLPMAKHDALCQSMRDWGCQWSISNPSLLPAAPETVLETFGIDIPRRSMVESYDNIDIMITQVGKEDAGDNTGNTPDVEADPLDYPETIDNSETSMFPYDPIESQVAVAKGYPTLNFKPLQIKTIFLGISAAFFLCCIGSITILVFSSTGTGYSFHIASTQNHMAFRYTPAIVGTITTILWRTIITTLGRMTPYISMASPQGTLEVEKHRRLARTLEGTYTDTSGLIAPARNRHWLYFLGNLTSLILMLVMVPLKASLIQLSPDSTGWVIVILPIVAYLLMALYSWLVFCSLAILIRLYNRETGLNGIPSHWSRPDGFGPEL
ncbi:hypothetical protein C8F01DRAFT_1337864 [Mycena amicta]|nr:hypothetical protein C8F01DRAFT_1337864 [Mycena amicta]